MGDMTIAELMRLLDKFGTLFCLVLFSVAIVRGWIVPKWAYDALVLRVEKETVPRWVYDKIEVDCKRMTELAERNAELAERSTAIAERVVPVAPAAK